MVMVSLKPAFAGCPANSSCKITISWRQKQTKREINTKFSDLKDMFYESFTKKNTSIHPISTLVYDDQIVL